MPKGTSEKSACAVPRAMVGLFSDKKSQVGLIGSVRRLKVAGNVKEITVTQTALARALNLTPARVNQLIQEEIVRRDEKDASGGVYLFDSVKNYLQSKYSRSDEANYFLEKARHEKVKRQTAELKLAKEEGRVYDAATVEAVMIEQLVGLRTHLSGLGMKLAAVLEGKSKSAIAEIINREIEEKLGELSEYKPELFEHEDESATASSDA